MLGTLPARAHQTPADSFQSLRTTQCISPSAQAVQTHPGRIDSPADSDFRKARAQGLYQVTAQGRKTIAGFNYAQLIKQTNFIHVYSAPVVCTDQEVGSFHFERSSARWTRIDLSHCIVQVSESKWPEVPADLKPLLAVHETFGCLGITDADFGCSTLLDVMANEANYQRLETNERSVFEEDLARLCQLTSTGGSVGVGGGGDWKPLKRRWMATQLLSEALSLPRRSAARASLIEELDNLLFTDFEQN